MKVTTKILVKSVLGNVCGIHTTTKDVSSFRVQNKIRTKMGLLYGPSPFTIEYVTAAPNSAR